MFGWSAAYLNNIHIFIDYMFVGRHRLREPNNVDDDHDRTMRSLNNTNIHINDWPTEPTGQQQQPVCVDVCLLIGRRRRQRKCRVDDDVVAARGVVCSTRISIISVFGISTFAYACVCVCIIILDYITGTMFHQQQTNVIFLFHLAGKYVVTSDGTIDVIVKSMSE